MLKSIQAFILVYYRYYKKKDPDIPFFSAIMLFLAVGFMNLLSLAWLIGWDFDKSDDNSGSEKFKQYLIGACIVLVCSIMMRSIIKEKDVLALDYDQKTLNKYSFWAWAYVFGSILFMIIGLILRHIEVYG